MAAGVTEVIVEKDQDETAEDTKKPEKKETKALSNGGKKSK